MIRKAAALLALALALPAHAAAPGDRWVRSWSASPTPPTLAPTGRLPPSARFRNQTLRQVVRISAGGTRLRVRISNEYGAAPLRIGAAHVGLAGEGGAVRAGSDRMLTFGGATTAVIPVGAPLVSDPVDLTAPDLASLAVSLYLPEDTGPCTCHPTGVQTGIVSPEGDFTAAQAPPVASTFTYRAFVSGVDVVPGRAGKTVVVLGDSISDGAVSTPDRNARWPDRLAERLRAASGGRVAWGVSNQGISGNRLLAGGAGDSALARFDRDVLATPGAAYLVVFVGVNDLGVGYGPTGRASGLAPPTVEDMIVAYRQLIARGRAHGLKVYGATITPYEGASYWTPEGERQRQAVNAWIRSSGAYDGVIDFDAAWRDPQKPTGIREPLQAGDHLHGSDEGYRVLGDAVDLALFR